MSLKVGLALGGGGARGVAHIAYLNALDELDIKPTIIAGTGVGALAGALYASGIKPDEMIGILEELDYRRAMKVLNHYSFKDSKYGVLDAVGAEEYLELVMPVKIFDRLYTPLKIVAANYETREQHIFEEGKVVPALRASMAVPGIFSPIEVDDQVFIDGGCVNPVPFDIIREECDVLIAIDISGKEASESEISIASTANDLSQCYQIMTNALIEEKSKNAKIDVLATPVLEGVQMLDFFNFENILEAVEDEVEEFKIEVAKILKPELLTKSGKPKKPKAKPAPKQKEVEAVEDLVEDELEEFEEMPVSTRKKSKRDKKREAKLAMLKKLEEELAEEFGGVED